ncbi:hypothetical protein [Streptomyces sp. NBC_01429]|uniref:hypothetical protein n=1 Tax=Streptomyces sp. NBC_01429 TaxID=2903862 RepID=UPI002E2E2E4E|nr:hypothetical protein [Streptomyces sp. NBC_01429]
MKPRTRQTVRVVLASAILLSLALTVAGEASATTASGTTASVTTVLAGDKKVEVIK